MASKVKRHPSAVRATQATLAAFRDGPLDWGRRHCGHLAAFHLAGMGIDARLDRFGAFDSERGAMLAVRRAGFSDLDRVLDDLGLKQIEFLERLPGDVIGRQTPGLMALSIYLGNGRELGAIPELGGFDVVQPLFGPGEAMPRAWRVPG